MILLKFDILLDNILILLTLQLLYCNEYCNIYIASITSQKPVMQALSVLDCSVEPHLLIVLVKVKNFFWQNVPATFVWKTRVSHVKTGIVYGRKTMMMMLLW